MNQYFVTIEAVFDKIRPLEPELRTADSVVAGYFRNYGVNATSLSEAEQMVVAEAAAPDAAISIAKSEQIDVSLMDDEVKSHFPSPGKVGIWYSSGCVYYPPSSKNSEKPRRRLPRKWKLQLATFAVGLFSAVKGFEYGMPILGWVSVAAVAIAVVTSVSKHTCANCGYPKICIGPRDTSFCPKCGNKDEAVGEQALPQ